MKTAAQILGVAWMATVALAGIVLLGSGVLRGGRGEMFLLFFAALPGILIFRWVRNLPPPKLSFAKSRPRAPIDAAALRRHRSTDGTD